MRAYGMLGPPQARLWLLIQFLLMWMLPGLLSKSGRQTIGIRKVSRPLWWLWAPLLGAVCALLSFGLGLGLFGHTADNWFIAVRDALQVPPAALAGSRAAVIAIYTVPAMLFSPIGEEIFFRGILHESFRLKWGAHVAITVNTMSFGVLHLLHHGIWRDAAGCHFRPLSGLIWVGLMTVSSWIFTLCRQNSGALWPAMLAHAAFNLVMNLTIFLLLF